MRATTCQTHFLNASGKCHLNQPGELSGGRGTVTFLYDPLYDRGFNQTKRGAGLSGARSVCGVTGWVWALLPEARCQPRAHGPPSSSVPAPGADAEGAERLQPPPGTREQCGLRGAHAPGRAGDTGGLGRRAGNKRRRGAPAERPARKTLRGAEARRPPRRRPSAGRPGRHAPARRPVPGGSPSCRPRRPPARRGRSSCSRTGSA